jgi:hypothetical protein
MTLVTGQTPKKRAARSIKVGRTVKVKKNKVVSRQIDHRLGSHIDRMERDGWKIEVEGFVPTPDGVGRWVARLVRFVDEVSK